MFASVRRRPTVIVASLTLALLMLAILLLGPVDQAQAGTLLKLSPDELDRLASKVLAAQVVGTYSREVGSAGSGGSQGYIETVVELRVLQGLKGVPQSRGETMTIVVPGGTVGGLTMVVDTAPPFRVGEAVKLHLDGKGRVVGGFQGKHWLTVTEAALYGAEPGALLEGETSAIESGTSDATVSGITPSSGSAGTGTLVAVSGSGFGSTKGTGKVEFTYKGTTMIEATDVRSWSDTQIVCAIPVDYDGYSRSAGSGPVKVTTGTGATVTYSSFSVTFGYGQVKWSGASTAYKVNSNTADTTGEEALVDAAAATWNAASSFQFIDEGPTDITESTYLDSVNAVYWTTLEDGVLGRNTYWFVGSTLIAFDVAMNDIYAWGTGASGTYDIQSIATHELGHALNLRDLYGDPDSNKIMYGYGSPGQVKRALSAGDIEGIQWIYGGGTPPTYTLTTNVVGSGTINVNPQQATYTSGTPVTLTATPASGWQFNGWSGAVTGSTNPVTITMDANKTVTATFTEVGAPGTVTRYEQNHACCQYAGSWTTYASSLYSGGSYSYTKTAGASVTVTFNGTAIDYIATKSSTQGSAQIILDGVNKGTVSLYSPTVLRQTKVWGVSGLTAGPHTLVITYADTGIKYINVDAFDVLAGGSPATYTLTTNVVGSGTINVNPQQATYTSGAVVQLTANPTAGWQFSGWSGDVTGSVNPASVTMTADKTVTATFTEESGSPTLIRIEQNDPGLQYQGTWATFASSYYSGGSYAYTNTAGSSVTLNFTGTGVDYIATKSSTQGSAQIILDGVNKGTVSLYSPTVLRQTKVWGVSGLTAGPHTLIIRYGGSKYTNVDAFDVWSTL